MKELTKAVVLAAGLGTRLRPLTDHRAKPSLPLFNQSIIGRLIDQLITSGIETVYINLHYQGWSVRRSLRSSQRKQIRIHFSYEPEILGTAGVLGPLQSHLEDHSFLMINGDIVHDVDLKALIDSHLEDEDVIATVALHPPSLSDGFPQVGSSEANRLCSFPYGPLANALSAWEGTFTGIHVIRPRIFDFIHQNAYQCINSGAYARALESGFSIGTFKHTGYWNDIGTPDRYLRAHGDVLDGRLKIADLDLVEGKSWHHPSCIIDPHATIGHRVVIGAGCRIGTDTVLNNVIVWPGVTVRPGSIFRNGILRSSGEFVPVGGGDGLNG